VLTTLQAIDLSNGKSVSDMLRTGAAKVVEKKMKRDELIDSLFRDAISRLPKQNERETAREILTEEPTIDSVADLIWVLVMLPEFQIVR
jgi:hypothetical protein